MTKPSRETIRKRVAGQRRNAAKRKRMAARRLRAELHGSMGPEVAAKARLRIDGAHSDDALRRRVRALAEERKLPPADYAKLLHKRIGMMAIGEFCEKHTVSYDWLLYGDLKGLARMTRERKSVVAAVSYPCDASPPEIVIGSATGDGGDAA